jgi:hypothetical protein
MYQPSVNLNIEIVSTFLEIHGIYVLYYALLFYNELLTAVLNKPEL